MKIIKKIINKKVEKEDKIVEMEGCTLGDNCVQKVTLNCKFRLIERVLEHAKTMFTCQTEQRFTKLNYHRFIYYVSNERKSDN